jgi:heptaprenyl diphosphate synthase
VDFVNEAARHLLDAGGKRFRPLLVLLAAEYGDPDAPGVVPAALVVELTHLATLYHDDVMDEADLRRGAASANARWDNSVAILTGDFLFARASDIVADLGPEAVRIQAQTFSRLVQGQIRETVGPRDAEDRLAHYLSVVADKTGSLIATSARLGAKMAGATGDAEAVLTSFGEQIGTAFQLSDDIIDIASETGESGKTPGTDLREGIPTLPTLLAQRSRDADPRLVALLSGPITDDGEHAEALTMLRAHPAMDGARDEVQRRADAARTLLGRLPDGPATQALHGLCDLVIHRTS